MTSDQTLLVATCGQGINRSTDSGKTWTRLPIFQDIEYDDIVRTLAVHPTDPNVIYAGFQNGVARSTDAGKTWHRLSSFLDSYAVWKLVVDPKDPNNIYVGTGAPTRAISARSKDGGETWERMAVTFPERCGGVSKPRLLAMAVDPEETNNVWLGAEEGGLFHSEDFGDNWRRVDTDMEGQDIMHTDIHDILIVPGSPKRVIVSTVLAMHISEDNGRTWTRDVAKTKHGLRYSRMVTHIPDGNGTLLYSVADSTPGVTAILNRSTDTGDNWEQIKLDPSPSTCLWAFSVNPADPKKVLAGTKFGELYESNDAGLTFKRHWRGFSEICALAWVPA